MAVATVYTAMAFFMLVGYAAAQSRQIGTAQNAVGTLIIVRADGVQERLQGKGALQLYEGDVLKTDPSGRALIDVMEGVQVALNEQTSVKIFVRWEKYKRITPIIRLAHGEVWFKSPGGSKALEVETPVAHVSADEGEFNLKVQEEGPSILTVIEGKAELSTPFDTCPIQPSTVTSIMRGKPCKKVPVTETASSIAWTDAVLK